MCAVLDFFGVGLVGTLGRLPFAQRDPMLSTFEETQR
jgi:hypothetical protein